MSTIHHLPLLKKRTAAAAFSLIVLATLRAQTDSIIYHNRYRAYIDSITFTATGKSISVRDYNPYNKLAGLQDSGRTYDGNVIWAKKPGKPSSFSTRLPLLESCRFQSLYSQSYVNGGRHYCCVGYHLVAYREEGGTVPYSTVLVFDHRGNQTFQLLHLKGSVASAGVDESGHYLTFSWLVPTFDPEDGSSSNCVYSILKKKFIYNFPVENWNPIVLTDGYIGLTTMAEATLKRYRVIDFREQLFYDMAIPYEQVAKIKKVTRDGFRMKGSNGEIKTVPYRDFAAPEKFPD